MINSYVDFDDYENVVKTFNDESFYYKLRKGFTREPEILLRKNFVKLNDEFFQMGQTEHKEFYSTEKTKDDFDFDPDNNLYAKISIRMEAREDTYERTVFSVFDYTGLIGGVFEIFEVLGGFIIGYFIKKWLVFDILCNLYQVQKKRNNQKHTERPMKYLVNDSGSQNLPEDSKDLSEAEDEKSKEPSEESKRENLEESKGENSEEEKSGGESEEEDPNISPTRQTTRNNQKFTKLKLRRQDCITNFSFLTDYSNKQFQEDDQFTNDTNENNNTKLREMLENRYRYGFSWWDYFYQTL